MKRLSATALLVLIILGISAFLRLYKLDSIPPSLYWEEAALGYDAYSIAKTGKDHHGNPFPVVAFPSFGDYKPSGYFYAVVPFVSTLGLNAWSVRLPSALAGIGSVFLVYLICKELFTTRSALVAAFLFGIQPWALQFSRGGWEVNLSLLVILAGAYFLLKARKKAGYIIVAAIFLALSMYIYHAARLFAPIIGMLGGVLLLREFWLQKSLRRNMVPVLIAFVVAFLVSSPLLVNMNTTAVSSRFTQTSIFSDILPIQKSNAAIEASGNTVFSKVFFHRYRFFAEVIIAQFFSHFSIPFLFLKGDGNLRHGTGTLGVLYPIESLGIAIALLIGIAQVSSSVFRLQIPKPAQRFLSSHHRTSSILLVVLWIISAAVAPSVVTPAPHALRFLFAAPAFAILASIGILHLVDRSPTKIKMLIILGVVGGYFFYTARFMSWSLLAYPVTSANDWQFGYKELFSTIEKQKKEGEKVFVSRYQGRPSMYYLFFSKFDPSSLQQMEPNLPKDQLELLQVGEYHFIDGVGNLPGLYATSPDAVPPQAEVTAVIRRPDITTVWVIWRQ